RSSSVVAGDNWRRWRRARCVARRRSAAAVAASVAPRAAGVDGHGRRWRHRHQRRKQRAAAASLQRGDGIRVGGRHHRVRNAKQRAAHRGEAARAARDGGDVRHAGDYGDVRQPAAKHADVSAAPAAAAHSAAGAAVRRADAAAGAAPRLHRRAAQRGRAPRDALHGRARAVPRRLRVPALARRSQRRPRSLACTARRCALRRAGSAHPPAVPHVLWPCALRAAARRCRAAPDPRRAGPRAAGATQRIAGRRACRQRCRSPRCAGRRRLRARRVQRLQGCVCALLPPQPQLADRRLPPLQLCVRQRLGGHVHPADAQVH
ncbi:hypothetical protein GGH99_009066, partial [Coemansia sp. RSA 1285]